MNLKICLLITLIIAIACTSSIDARQKRSRRRKTHHSSSNKNKSSSYQKEHGSHVEKSQPTSKSDLHSTSKQLNHGLETTNAAPSHVDVDQNKQQPATQTNIPLQNTHSSEGDFAAGYAAGTAAARRRRRRKTTTVAPSTTTSNPCASVTSMPNNSLQQNPAGSVANCEVLSSTASTPLQNFNEQL